MRLVAIGLIAGVISGLFGIGGGILIVPLLVMWLGYEQRTAAATSLAAIGVIAAVGVVAYAIAGKVEPVEGALVGVPAAAGAALGTILQQRIANRTLSLLFAGFLTVLAVRFLVS